MNTNNNVLIFIDFPDPDNFLMVLYCAKQLKQNEELHVVCESRPTNVEYAPFYIDDLKNKYKFKPKGFIFPIINDYDSENYKKEYIDFKNWFEKDEINYNDTNLVFNINIIRLNKFLKKEGINNIIKFYKSSKNNIPNVGMRHHFHKMEWSFDFQDNKKYDLTNKLNCILDKWKNSKNPISKKYGNEIRNILNEYIKLNEDYKIKIYNLSELNNNYSTFLVGGPFTCVKEVIDNGIKPNLIIAMSSAINTGTDIKSANLFPDQFNNYVDHESAKYVLSQPIKTILIPTETTKPWLKINNGLTFKSKDISSWGENICNLFKLYNGFNSLNDPNKEHAIFDLIVPIIYYNNYNFNDENLQKVYKIYKNNGINIIIECTYNNKHIKKNIKEKKENIIWDNDKNEINKYILVGNTNINDKILLNIKSKIIINANKYFQK